MEGFTPQNEQTNWEPKLPSVKEYFGKDFVYPVDAGEAFETGGRPDSFIIKLYGMSAEELEMLNEILGSDVNAIEDIKAELRDYKSADDKSIVRTPKLTYLLDLLNNK